MKRLFISQPMRGKTDTEILTERTFARSIKDLATADIAIFIGEWKNYRGCRIEHLCAVEYGIDII